MKDISVYAMIFVLDIIGSFAIYKTWSKFLFFGFGARASLREAIARSFSIWFFLLVLSITFRNVWPEHVRDAAAWAAVAISTLVFMAIFLTNIRNHQE